MPRKRNVLLSLCIALIIFIVVVTIVVGINWYMKYSVTTKIITSAEAKELDADCILILGAGVWNNSRPSHMLEDRLLQGIELYHQGSSDRILMSGDHGSKEYDEVNIMKQYAIEKGVSSSHIFMDHAGFSTYESLYRAKEIFQAKKIIIVTQEYHMYRALYIAKALGIDAYGVTSDPRTYVGQEYRELREMAARLKDFAYAMVKPKPTYLGASIPVSGNGDITNDGF